MGLYISWLSLGTSLRAGPVRMAQSQVSDVLGCEKSTAAEREYSVRNGTVTLTIQRVQPNHPSGTPSVNVIVKLGPRSLKLDGCQWRELLACGKDVELFAAFLLGQISVDTDSFQG